MNQNIATISARSLNNTVRKDEYVAISLYFSKEQKSYSSRRKGLPKHFDNGTGEFTDTKGDTIKLNS